MKIERYENYYGEKELTFWFGNNYFMFDSKGNFEFLAAGYGSGYEVVPDITKRDTLSKEEREILIKFLQEIE